MECAVSVLVCLFEQVAVVLFSGHSGIFPHFKNRYDTFQRVQCEV